MNENKINKIKYDAYDACCLVDGCEKKERKRNNWCERCLVGMVMSLNVTIHCQYSPH